MKFNNYLKNTVLIATALFATSVQASEYLLSVCDELNYVQLRGGKVFLPNQGQPYTGLNYCKYDTGTNRSKGNYNNGLKDGVWSNWNADGSINNRMTYKNGEYYGMSDHYYEDGQLKESTMWIDGKKTGKSEQWFNTTQRKHLRHYLDDVEDGEFKDWAENGQIITHGFKKIGIYDGMYTRWFDHLYNQKMVEHNIIDGKIDGKMLKYYESGQLAEQREYKMGVLDGTTITFFDQNEWSGAWFIKTQEKYEDGKIVSFKEYNAEAKLLMDVGNKDRRNGVWYWWYPQLEKFSEISKDSVFLTPDDYLNLDKNKYLFVPKAKTISKKVDLHLFINEDVSLSSMAIYDASYIPEEALKYYNRALELVNKNDKMEVADETFVALSEDELIIKSNSADVTFFDLKKEDESLAAYERTYELNKKNPRFLVEYASILATKNDNSFAGLPIELVKQALVLDPDNPYALYLAGLFAVGEQKYDLAKALWEQALSFLPKGSEDRNLLIGVLSDMSRLMNGNIEPTGLDGAQGLE